tara:strand:+ start:572 stop:1459 length:888 start_codon:yes stop_codon:yes gene_type:complete
MLKYIPIILFFCFSSAERLEIENDKIAVFNVYNNQHFLLNNRHYRESINPIFTLNLRKGEYIVSKADIKLFDGRAVYGKPYLKNRILKPNKPLLVSKVEIVAKKNSDLYILATAYNVYPVKNRYKFTLYYNNNPIYSSMTNSFEYFTVLKSLGERNSFALYVEGDINACLCPTIGTGYNSGYQLAAWEKSKDKNKNANKITTNIPINIPVNINQKNDNYDPRDIDRPTQINLTVTRPKNNKYNHTLDISSNSLTIDYKVLPTTVKDNNINIKSKINLFPNIFGIFYKYLDFNYLY